MFYHLHELAGGTPELFFVRSLQQRKLYGLFLLGHIMDMEQTEWLLSVQYYGNGSFSIWPDGLMILT